MLTIDRIVSGIAVCEDADGRMIELPVGTLPKGVREGDLLRLDNGVYTVDTEATEERRARLYRLQQSLFGQREEV